MGIFNERKRAANAGKINHDPLNSSPCRFTVPIVQCILLAATTAMVIAGAVFMAVDGLSYRDANEGV